MGSAKGKTKCVNIEIINDGLKEGQETFVESATIVSPNTAIFGGAIQSSSGNIKVNITDNDCKLCGCGDWYIYICHVMLCDVC